MFGNYGGSEANAAISLAYLGDNVEYVSLRQQQGAAFRETVFLGWCQLGERLGRKRILLAFRNIAIRQVRETSSDKGIVFPSYTHFIYTNRSE